MITTVFSIISINKSGLDEWIAAGRAYEDVNIGDILTDSQNKTPYLRVVAITTYGRNTDLLSKMMTGNLHLKSDNLSEEDVREMKLLHRVESTSIP